MWSSKLDKRLTLGQELGVGAFARVHVGKLDERDQEVAVKMLRANRRKDEAMLRMMEREVQILQALADGPRVVRLVATGTLHRQRVMILELCDYGSVWEAVTRSGLMQPLKHYVGLPRASVRAIARDVVAALKYVHARPRQIIHADLKPENVFIRRGPSGYEYVLGDFGSASTLKVTKVHDYVQSRYYRAPEINLGRTHGTNITPSIDVWSLGCIVFELLVGRPLFRARDRTELAHLHVVCLGFPPNQLMRIAQHPTLYTRSAVHTGSRPLRQQWSSLRRAAAAIVEQEPNARESMEALPAVQAQVLQKHLPESTVYVRWLRSNPKHADALCWRLGQPEIDTEAHEFIATCVSYHRPGIADIRVPYIQ
jgi:serine/threonine protein kinase